MLGDNIFYGSGFSNLLKNSVDSVKNDRSSVIFGYSVKDPERYGVVEFSKDNKVIGIEEKPKHPKSNIAVVGLYFYPNNVIEIAKDVIPSKRGELEITSINSQYIKRKSLNVEILGRGFAWLDTGTVDSINNASNYIRTLKKDRV